MVRSIAGPQRTTRLVDDEVTVELEVEVDAIIKSQEWPGIGTDTEPVETIRLGCGAFGQVRRGGC